ncbi:hypothetical protein ACRALDRAFT_205847 [Sodiomyces alcalophilus JCM 7366]|uniref:uncharacterized protein n=1 Tax=Sodiomyces alcalophilus JCM 7366 TaxID=591952 RepID=UPI0039B3F578
MFPVKIQGKAESRNISEPGGPDEVSNSAGVFEKLELAITSLTTRPYRICN